MDVGQLQWTFMVEVSTILQFCKERAVCKIKEKNKFFEKQTWLFYVIIVRSQYVLAAKDCALVYFSVSTMHFFCGTPENWYANNHWRFCFFFFFNIWIIWTVFFVVCLLSVPFLSSPLGCECCILALQWWTECYRIISCSVSCNVLSPLNLPCSCYDTDKDTLAFTKVDAFLPNKIYYHGCLKSFLQITKWNGPEVHEM